MTDRQMNDIALDLICQVTATIEKFQQLRDMVDDETWDVASETHCWVDVLTEIESQVESYM